MRSSALGEDSAQAPFAGEFATVLNVKTDQERSRKIRVPSHFFKIFGDKDREIKSLVLNSSTYVVLVGLGLWAQK